MANPLRAKRRRDAVQYLIKNPTANAYQVSKATKCSYTYAAKLIKQRGTPVEKLVDKPVSLLDVREKTHGNYAVTAEISQSLKDLIAHKATVYGLALTYSHWESLDMICVKIARILSGNADEPDHWRDIAGYANLIVRELERENDKD